MSLHNWPAQEKPREKLLQQGPKTLSNAELLAIVFGQGCPNKDAVSLARDLLNHYGSLQNLFQASFQSLSQHCGIGLAKYAQLQAGWELNKRYLQEPLQRKALAPNSFEMKKYLAAELRGDEREFFACLFLDNRLRLICFEKLFAGTIDNATVHPREVAKRALILNAKAIIIAHNHPSGDTTPSQADHDLTHQLVNSLNHVEIELIDHIIVGADATLSFAESGYLYT